MFTVPPKRLREMDVALGPCVPTGGRKRSLVGPLRQDRGETPRMTAALLTALTGSPAGCALTAIDSGGKGLLHECSEPFVQAMASANRLLSQLATEDKVRGDSELTSFVAKLEEYDLAWQAAVHWPREVVSTRNRLGRMGWARIALERNQPLYCWHGPAVAEFVVVSGEGPYPGRRTE